jgi:hypothetical protein
MTTRRRRAAGLVLAMALAAPAGIAAGKRVVTPFNLKALSDSPAEHLRCAQNWIAHEVPPAAIPLVQAATCYRYDRIRLPYVSADFTNSAVATAPPCCPVAPVTKMTLDCVAMSHLRFLGR